MAAHAHFPVFTARDNARWLTGCPLSVERERQGRTALRSGWARMAVNPPRAGAQGQSAERRRVRTGKGMGWREKTSYDSRQGMTSLERHYTIMRIIRNYIYQ